MTNAEMAKVCGSTPKRNAFKVVGHAYTRIVEAASEKVVPVKPKGKTDDNRR